jgi:hypothetical protein
MNILMLADTYQNKRDTLLGGSEKKILFTWQIALALSLLVALSRWLFWSPVYFADGPAHISAIQAGTYMIQPPGYWLFNRIASLFARPELAISILNTTCAAAGTGVFYLVAVRLVPFRIAVASSIAYATVFYAWFAGEVHSTYASQLLFPVLTFYFMLRHKESGRTTFLVLACGSFVIGAGLRPSDGAFMLPMVIYYAFKRGLKTMLPSAMLVLIGCFAWLIPSALAYEKLGRVRSSVNYVPSILTVTSPLFHPLRGVANDLRFIVPFLVAFWPIVWFLRYSKDEESKLLWLWLLPGTLFFLVFYVSDAPYLAFITAPIILLAARELRNRITPMVLCAVCNASFFLLFTPIHSHAIAVETFNVYAGRYTRYAISHKWQPNLSELMGAHVYTPGADDNSGVPK